MQRPRANLIGKREPGLKTPDLSSELLKPDMSVHPRPRDLVKVVLLQR
jgi:hypothetical protein